MDGGESFIFFVSALVINFVLPLLILLQPEAAEVLFQHVTVLELVIGPSLVVRAGLLNHLVEDGPLWGPQGFLRSTAATESSLRASRLIGHVFFLLLFFLGPLLGPSSLSAGAFPLSFSWLKKALTASSPAA
jgi:hypothetical protein